MDARYFDFVFRGIGELDGVKTELEELLAINVRLQNQNLENAKKAREERDARRQAAEEAKQAAMAQIQAELGVGKALESQKGIIEEIRQRIKLLKQGREEANDVASINKYNAALDISQKQLNTLTGATDKFKGSNGFWREMQGWVVGALAVDRLTNWGSTLVSNESKLLGQQTALQAVLKSNTDYQSSLSFLSKLSNEYGQDLLSITGSYTKFIASSESSNLSLKERNRIYESVVKAGSTLKLSNDEINGSLLAVSQMFSKGNVQAEELRGQLGERLPGAFGLAAKAMGVSEAKLNDMLKAGQVMAVDLLPKLATELDKTFGAAAKTNLETVSGSLNYAKNKVLEYFDAQNKAYGITDKVAGGYRWIADNLGLLVGVAKSAIITWGIYQVVTKGSLAITTAWNVAKKALLVYQGLEILALEAQTGATVAYTTAQIAARNAAVAFSGTLAATPWGAIALAVAGAVIALQQYTQTTDEANEYTLQAIKNTDEEIKGLITKKERINAAAGAIFNLKEGSDAYKLAVGNLIKQSPEYFGKLDAETARYEDIRIAVRLANNEIERKIRLMAAEKLAEKVAGKVADVKLQIAEEEVANAQRLVKQQEYQKKQLELQKKGLQDGYDEQIGAARITEVSLKEHTDKLKKLKEDESKYDLLLQKVSIDQATAQQKVYTERFQELVTLRKGGAIKTQKEFNEEVKKLNDEFFGNQEKHEKGITNLGKGEGDKRKKEKIDSLKTLALIQEKADNDALEKTRLTEQKSLELQRDIDIQRINDSKASATKKSAEKLKAEEKYFLESSKLTNKYDDDEAKEQEKRNREWLKANYEMHKDTLEQAAKKTAEQQKLNQKEYDEKKKLDEKVAKETEKLNEDKYELINKLRILDKISHAKNSEEIIKIENQEKEKILDEAVKTSEKLVLIAQLRLARMKVTYGEDSTQYKESLAEMVIAQQGYTDVSIQLAEFRTDKAKDEAKKQEDIFKQALGYATQVTDGLFELFDKSIDNRLAKTSDATQKRMLEYTKAEAKITKDALGAITSLASGDIPGAISKGITAIFSAMNAEMEREMTIQKAKVEEYARIIGERITKLKDGVQSTVSSISEMNKIYADLIPQTIYQAQEKFIESVGRGSRDSINAIDQRIQLEIKYGQQIIDNYDKAVKAEEKLYNDKVSNINKEFDLRDLKATQSYNAQTLAITAAGSAQLEALITNEASLASVRDEFAAKRLAVEQSFPLASKAITDDMSQAEIDAINASIKARDEQFAKIQAWYNEELIFIATSEGQKRKEYTETEKIQNQIRENLELAAIQFEANEIARQKEKDDALVAAAQAKNLALVKLEEEKDLALAASFQRLTDFMKQQIAEVQAALLALKPENVEQFKELQAILESIRNAYKDLTGINPATLPVPANPNTNNLPARGPRSFFKGTERLSNMSGQKGVDTELIKADVGERIIPTYLNNMLKAKFGSDITNEGLVFRAMNPTLPIMNYDAIANMGNVSNTFDKKAMKETMISAFKEGMKEMKQVNVNVVNGHPSVEERSSNRMIKYVS